MLLVGLRVLALTLIVGSTTCVWGAVAHADEVREALPFLADGASYPQGRPPPLLWPERSRADDVPGTELRDADATHETTRLPAAVPPFPDVSQLLAPIPGVRLDAVGSVAYPEEHAERARIERLLRAVRVGYARDIRVEIVVHRLEGAAERRTGEHPTPEDMLVAGGELRVDTSTRAGALVFDDARREVSLPALAVVTTALVTPDVAVFRVGPRVAFTVTPLAHGAFVLDLDLHLSRTGGPVVLDGTAVRRAVPILDVLAIRAALPLATGRASLIEMPGARIAVRVTQESRALPDGVAVLALPAHGRALPAARRLSADEQPLLSAEEPDDGPVDRGGGARGSGRRLRVVPDAWLDAALHTGVRVAFVPPGIAVVEGAPDAVAQFVDFVRATRAPRGLRVTSPSVRLTVVAGTSWTIAAGRLEPVRRRLAAATTLNRAVAVSEVSYQPFGTFAHGRPDGAGLHVVVDDLVPIATRAHEAGVVAADATTVRATRREATLVVGDDPADGISVEHAEDGR